MMIYSYFLSFTYPFNDISVPAAAHFLNNLHGNKDTGMVERFLFHLVWWCVVYQTGKSKISNMYLEATKGFKS